VVALVEEVEDLSDQDLSVVLDPLVHQKEIHLEPQDHFPMEDLFDQRRRAVLQVVNNIELAMGHPEKLRR
jgi:hypothetical protein